MSDNPQTTDFPAGAIHNGRVHIERLEQIQFDGKNSHIQNFSDWQHLKNCFEYMASFIEANHG